MDNIDYEDLYQLATSIGVTDESLRFFEVHRYADHFEKASHGLDASWRKDPSKVREAFEFIGSHQLTMWRNLSDTISDYQYS